MPKETFFTHRTTLLSVQCYFRFKTFSNVVLVKTAVAFVFKPSHKISDNISYFSDLHLFPTSDSALNFLNEVTIIISRVLNADFLNIPLKSESSIFRISRILYSPNSKF